MGVESDLLAQVLQKLAEVLSEARELKSRRQFELASRTLGDTWKSVFGLDRRFLQMMHPEQVPSLLGDRRRVRGLVQLLDEEADLLRQQGDVASAAATARWAIRVADAAKLPPDDLEVRALLARLRTMASSAP